MTVNLLDRAVRRSFTALCWEVGTPVAYKALLALEREDWLALTTMKVEVAHYTCARTLSGDLQVVSFFKKYPDFDLGIDKKRAAVDNFWSSERQCYETNERLSPLLFDVSHYGEGVRRFITDVRKEVSRVLGRCPTVSELEPRFGPGSTFLDVGPLTTVPDKMSESYTLTESMRKFLHAWDQTAWARYACAGLEHRKECHHFDDPEVAPGLFQNATDDAYAPRGELVVRGNRFTAVPKDAHKLRGICIEPSINLFYQLGIGGWISRRLRTVYGWDKESQQETHRQLAKIGSAVGGNATIDLSNASDTMSSALVRLLVPSRWFNMLDDLRSKSTYLNAGWVKLEKFSSMGNGFTFELETLLFRCIAEVACRETPSSAEWGMDQISTFGDDIIVPKNSAQNVIAALRFLGFKTNVSKTFIAGGFRESCGGDYFRGQNVRPHYLKENPSEPHQYIALANGLRRFGIRHILCGGPDLYRKPWLRILDALPKRIRDCRGPEALGDLVIQSEESAWKYEVRSSIRYFRVWRPVSFGRTSWDHFRPGVVLASALYGVGDGRPQNVTVSGAKPLTTDGVVTRVNGSYISGYRFGRVSYS